MEYKLNTTGERVRLDVLANADKSLIGLQIENSEIISMAYSELRALVIAILGIRELNNFDENLMKHYAFPKNEDDLIVVMKTVEEELNWAFVLDALKLFQSSDVFSCYFLTYNDLNGRIKRCGHVKILNREHAVLCPYKPYKITNAQKLEFQNWFENHKRLYYDGHKNKKFCKMKRLYIDSYLIGDADHSFLMLFIVLEMLFGIKEKLKFRISVGTGRFLSNEKEEQGRIAERVKELYTVRSKYVHEGRNVSWEALFELREIVRKVIVCMYEKGMYVEGFDFKEFYNNMFRMDT